MSMVFGEWYAFGAQGTCRLSALVKPDTGPSINSHVGTSGIREGYRQSSHPRLTEAQPEGRHSPRDSSMLRKARDLPSRSHSISLVYPLVYVPRPYSSASAATSSRQKSGTKRPQTRWAAVEKRRNTSPMSILV